MLIRSKRPEIFDAHSNPNLGPGSYDPSVPAFRPKNGVAPFGSSSERVTIETLNTPGPGEYDPTPRSTQLPLKPTAQFLSKEHRMGREYHKPVGYDVPGPGSYTGELVQEYVPPKGTRSLHSGSGINWVKVATAPSIPAREQSYGYREGGYGELVQQPVPYDGHTGRDDDVPGPGHYQVKDDLVKKGSSKGPNFSKTSGRRAADTLLGGSRGTVVGPGSYDVDRSAVSHVMHGGIMSKKQTSAFSSTTSRAPLSTTMYGPGPGAYKPQSSFKSLREYLAANPETFQAFGTSAANPRSEPQRLDVPGPGSYTGALVPKPPLGGEPHHSSVFSSTVDRFAQPPSVGPGPGGYEHAHPSFVDNVKSRLKGKFGVFGSTATRLPPPPPPQAPAPGTYNPQETNPAELRRRDKRSPAFRPSGTRDDPTHKTQGAPTFYDVKYDWPKPTTLAPALAGTVPRFHGRSETSDIPGPGQYPLPNSLADRARETTHAGSSVWSKGKRFQRYDNDCPGPGQYNVGAETLVKKSFNITIGDAWE